MILYAPVLFESERAQMEELQRSQQKQVSYVFRNYIVILVFEEFDRHA